MKKCSKYMDLDLFSDNDIATEILSRLDVKSLMAFKCTAKRWYNFASDPLFLRIHYQRSEKITGLMMQNMVKVSRYVSIFDSIDLFTPTKTGYVLSYKSLDFLPEKVIVLSSSNGILCCRTWVNRDLRRFQKKTITYICNPITRQWVQFRSNIDDYKNEYGKILIPGFAFYPFCSSSGAASVFKLVKIFYNYECWSYSFDIYSSDTKKWKRSKALCKTKSTLCETRCGDYPSRVVFANGWLHWWTDDYSIIAFHVENELSKQIKLPCAPIYTLSAYECGMICWGESEGYFHYVYAYGPQLQVWVLKDYEEEEPAWELKYCLDMARFCDQYPSLYDWRCSWIDVLTFDEDVLYIRNTGSVGSLLSYNFRTKTFIDHGELVRQSDKDPDSTIVSPFCGKELCPIVIPFSASLLPLHGVRRSKRNRKRKRLEI